MGALPLSDGSCDVVMSMNGFHAFPDKKKAFRETYRVLKPGGRFSENVIFAHLIQYPS